MKRENTKDKGGVCAGYRRQIVEMLEKIENPTILMKIYTFVKTHLEILREKEQED